MTEIADVIRNDLVITEENVQEMSETAEMYSCFKNVSRVLNDKCLRYYMDSKGAMDTEDPAPEDTMDKEDNMDSNDPEAPTVASSVPIPIGEENVEESGGSQDEREIASVGVEVSLSNGGDEEDSGQDTSICCSERDRLKMSLKNVCWVNFLKTETDLPADVTFKFYEKTKTVDGGEVRKFVGDLKAHKLLLASCSEVFKDSFFHSSNLQTHEVVIEDCSIRAFRIMVDFIYGRFPRLRVGSDICEMFEILNVAEKFRIVGLKEEYKSSMMLYFRHLYKEHRD